LDRAKSTYDSVVTTRTKQLDRSIAKVNQLTDADVMPALEG